MKRSLSAIALARPITVAMIALTLLALGMIAWDRISLEFLPRLDVPFVGCHIPYPGATPEQIEQDVAIPAEGEFRTLPHLKRISTWSDSNECYVRLVFDWEADMDVVTADVRDRLERLKRKLPEEIDRLFLERFSSDSLPVMGVAMFRKEGAELDLAHLVRTVIRPRLIRLDGVADVQVYAMPEDDVLIEFDQDKLRRHNLTMYDVVAVLRRSSVDLPVGQLVEGRTRFYVRVSGEFERPEEIAELPIGSGTLRLKDVAEVGYRSRQVDYDYAVDQKLGAVLLVVKESEANTIAVCEAAQEEVDRLFAGSICRDTEGFVFFNQGEMIGAALSALWSASKYGGLLAVGVLLLFLRRLRPTLAVAFAIPASLTTGLVFMYFAGISLNLVTMLSMIVAVGLLVDNSIVVVENIHRHAQLGRDPRESALRGASEVGLAITAATVTTVVVFVPVIYMETGEMALFMKQFAAPLCVALGASLFVALTVIPLVLARPITLSRRTSRVSAQGASITASQGRLVPWVIAGYERCLDWTIRRRLGALLIMAGILVLTVLIPLPKLGLREMPDVDLRQVNISIDFDRSYDIASAREAFDLVEGRLNAWREELGIQNVWRYCGTSGGQLGVYLTKSDDLPSGTGIPVSTEDVLRLLWERMPDRMPGVSLKCSIPDSIQGEKRGITVRFLGDDTQLLEAYADRFAVLLEEVPGIRDVRLSIERDKDEVRVRVDEALAAEAGVSPMVIARSVDFALRGTRLYYLKHAGREVPVWAQFREDDRRAESNLVNLAVPTEQAGMVPLSRLVRLDKGKSPRGIERWNGKVELKVSAAATGRDRRRILHHIRRLVDHFHLPQGNSIEIGEELTKLEENVKGFLAALALAIVLIYLVMGALFESYVLPLSILTSVPQAFVGVCWILYLTGNPLDTVALIGIVLMVGVVVNNGIVVVDHVNQLRREGLPRREALLRAGRDRFRPVVMTTLTTILGCIPIALSGAMGSRVSFAGLGLSFIGGLATGAVLTLFVVPLFYTFADDLQQWMLDFLSALPRRRRSV